MYLVHNIRFDMSYLCGFDSLPRVQSLAQLSRFVSPPPPQVSTAETMRAVLLVVVVGVLASVQAASVSDEIVRQQWKVSLCKLYSVTL